MKVSWRWLQEVAPGLAPTPEAAAERLALRGAPVESLDDLAQGLGDVVVGRVLEVGPHPDADRLSLCTVAGPAGEVPVVCGAPDVRAGACYPFAPVGAVLPGGFKIGRRKIRGRTSAGMLCSERELGLGPDHEGIMLLEGDHEPGAPFAAAVGLDDARLDVEVTPNRGDLLCHVGVARELHPKGCAGIVLPSFPGRSAGETASQVAGTPFARGGAEIASEAVRVRIEEPELCSRYLAAAIRGVVVGPSPPWLANRLRAAGARPVNNVVDATNYVMLELGQPLHAFDLAKLADATVVVGSARPGETLVTLDGERRPLAPEMLTIRDAEQPVAVAGVMGGANSEVSADTTDVLLECALFEPRQVRAARRALGMSTEASYRFERGVDPETMETAVLRAASLVLAVAGGAVDGPVVDACPAPWTPPVVTVRPSRVARVLGVSFSPDEIAGLLEPLGYAAADQDWTAGEPATAVEGAEAALAFRVPGHRSCDTLREVDLIEEVARVHGYDAFPDALGSYRPGSVPDHPLFRLEDDLRADLTAAGISEAQTPALGPESDGDVPVLNPVSAQEGWLRRDRLSGLLPHVERNMSRGVGDVRLFEFGTAFAPAPESAPPVETPRVAVVLTGLRAPTHWSGAGETFDVFDAAWVLERIVARAHPGARVTPADAGDDAEADHPHFAPGRWHRVTDDEGRVVGAGGEVRRERLDLPPWAGVVVGAEVVLPELPDPPSPAAAVELPDQPSSSRDVAMLLPQGVAAGKVLDAFRAGGVAVLEDVAIFDLYEGAGLPSGARSVGFRLRFRARDRTLTEAEVERSFGRLLRKVKEKTGVEPRG